MSSIRNLDLEDVKLLKKYSKTDIDYVWDSSIYE